jgi:hypothetical protein
MKLFKKGFCFLTGLSFIMTGVNTYAAAGIVCPAVNEINSKCNPSSHLCEFYAPSGGAPNDFSGLHETLSPHCIADFDCNISTSKNPIAAVSVPGGGNDNDAGTCYYTLQNGAPAFLYSYHYPRYDYTPVDAPECKGATPSDKSGYCVTYSNTAGVNK